MGLSGRWQRVTLLGAGILIGAALVGTPVGAHIGGASATSGHSISGRRPTPAT